MIRTALRWALALFFAVAGTAHLADPVPFLAITPAWVPWKDEVILWTGIAELFGAAALVQPLSGRLRTAGAVGLALYATCVFPANINHFAMDMARTDGAGPGLAYHLPRMVAQPIIIWLALWTGGVIDWPIGRRPAS